MTPWRSIQFVFFFFSIHLQQVSRTEDKQNAVFVVSSRFPRYPIMRLRLAVLNCQEITFAYAISVYIVRWENEILHLTEYYYFISL